MYGIMISDLSEALRATDCNVPSIKIFSIFLPFFPPLLLLPLTIHPTCSLSRARRRSTCPRHTTPTTTTTGPHGVQQTTSKTTSQLLLPLSHPDAQSTPTTTASSTPRRRTTNLHTTTTTTTSLFRLSPSSTLAAPGARHVRAFTQSLPSAFVLLAVLSYTDFLCVL